MGSRIKQVEIVREGRPLIVDIYFASDAREGGEAYITEAMWKDTGLDLTEEEIEALDGDWVYDYELDV